MFIHTPSFRPLQISLVVYFYYATTNKVGKENFFRRSARIQMRNAYRSSNRNALDEITKNMNHVYFVP